MSLFPFISANEESVILDKKELPLIKDVAIDFKTGSPLIENKSFKIVEGKEALKVWIYRALKIDRFQYLIYSWNFGSELSDLMGKGYTPALTRSEIKRYIEETLLINPYITSLDVLETSFSDSVLKARIKVQTLYGQLEVEI